MICEPLAPFTEVKVIAPEVHSDARGLFVETYRTDRYRAAGIDVRFVQDNLSTSRRDVLRGLHFQHPLPQAKLVRVTSGVVWDVVVDIRIGSPHFGTWAGIELSAEDQRQLFIPAGFAHGFVVLSGEAILEYKCSVAYHPEHSRSLRWNDPTVGVKWPVARPRLSERDARAPLLQELAHDQCLPTYPG